MNDGKKPTPETRLMSHLLVGLGAGSIISRKVGANAFLIGAILTALAHEALDAPVAQILTDLGA